MLKAFKLKKKKAQFKCNMLLIYVIGFNYGVKVDS